MNIFEEKAIEYDGWFETHEWVYQSEVEAVEKFIPETGKGIEIGVGTGRFSIPFGIKVGVDSAHAMAKIAKERGSFVYQEIKRILDEECPLGKRYKEKTKKSKFYKNAKFYPVNQILDWLKDFKFGKFKIVQTIFRNPDEIQSLETIKVGFGKGLFVVISAKNKKSRVL